MPTLSGKATVSSKNCIEPLISWNGPESVGVNQIAQVRKENNLPSLDRLVKASHSCSKLSWSDSGRVCVACASVLAAASITAATATDVWCDAEG